MQQFSQNDLDTIIQALASHCEMTRISLRGNGIREGGIDALAVFLNGPNTTLSDLDLGLCSLGDEEAVILGTALAENGTLRKLNLSANDKITNIGWRAIFAWLQSVYTRLENLSLESTTLDDATANLLGNILANSTHLRVLNMSSIYTTTTEGLRSVFDALQSPRCILQELDLCSRQ